MDRLGRLTTHVLDTAQGRPAAGVPLELWRVTDAARVRVKGDVTNADGRVDRPLLDETEIRRGRYDLEFDVLTYFRAQGLELSDPPFLDTIRIRFAIADPGQHYHVPLLVSPWAYSTYRGS